VTLFKLLLFILIIWLLYKLIRPSLRAQSRNPRVPKRPDIYESEIEDADFREVEEKPNGGGNNK